MIPRAPVPALASALAIALVAACSRGEAPEPVETARAPAPPASSIPAPRSVGGIAAVRTDVDGVVADLLTAERGADRLVVAIRFRNVSREDRRIRVSEGYPVGWRLTAGGRDWPLARGPGGAADASAPPDRILAPGQTALWRGSFVAPPEGVGTFRLEIPGVRPFEDVAIREAD